VKTGKEDAASITQEQKVILFLTDESLREMIWIKERKDDPALFVMDLLELFYIQHE
jgi:hypothetical protein